MRSLLPRLLFSPFSSSLSFLSKAYFSLIAGATMSDPHKQSDISGVTALRRELGFDDSHHEFINTVRYFRLRFKSSQGLPGRDLIEWKSVAHQNALSEMVEAFLERDGHGEKFWPDEETAYSLNKLTYWNRKDLISDVMRQLFWRLNVQSHRNNKYSKNKKCPAKKAPKGRGLSHDDPVDLDSVGRITSAAAASISVNPGPHHDLVIDPALYGPYEPPTIDQNAKDPYRVHKSHGLDIQLPNNQPMFAVMSSTSNPKNKAPSKKRPRTDAATATQPSSLAKRSRRSITTGAMRSPPEKRRIRNREGCEPPDDFLATRRSSERLSTPEEVGDNTPKHLRDNTRKETTSAANTSDPMITYQKRPPLTPITEGVIDQDDRDFTSTFLKEVAMQLNGEGHSYSAQEGVETPQLGAPIAQMSTTQELGNDVTSLSSERSTIVTVDSVSEHSNGLPVFVDKSGKTQGPAGPRVNEMPQAVLVPKVYIHFAYNVITRYPKRRSMPWTPDGSFKEKTLSGLMRELPVDLQDARMKYLHFSAVILEADAAYDVHDGQEDEFARMKRSLAKFIC
ncbi:hypothetical protein CcaCcLH18_12838 [Colletotrichum camelliae]|nr:hypothetical protein CcaCcLH18_12838 [Colletotrichum camelliae]